MHATGGCVENRDLALCRAVARAVNHGLVRDGGDGVRRPLREYRVGLHVGGSDARDRRAIAEHLSRHVHVSEIFRIFKFEPREHQRQDEEHHRERELHQYALPVTLPVQPTLPQQPAALARDECPARDVSGANRVARGVEVLVGVVHQRLGILDVRHRSGDVQRLSRLHVTPHAAPRDRKENLLECRARDAVALEPQSVQLTVEFLEQLGKLRG